MASFYTWHVDRRKRLTHEDATVKWRRVRAVMTRHLLEMRHTPSRSNDMLIWPFIDTLMFGSLAVFFARQSSDGFGAEYMLTGLFLYHVVYQNTVALSIGFMTETGARNLLNILTTPSSPSEYGVGLALFGFIRSLLGLTTIALLVRFIFHINVFAGGPGILLIAGLLVFVGMSLSLFLIGLQLRFGRAAEQATWGLAVLIPTISGALYPIDALPGFLQPISRILPTTHAFTAGRSLVRGDGMPWNDIAITAIGAAVLLALCWTFAAAMFRAFRHQGLVARYN